MNAKKSEIQPYILTPASVETLVARYRAPLEFFASGIVGDLALAEDVVSETIVKLLLKQPTVKDERALKTYLYTTAKRVAIDILRKKKREKEYVKREISLAETDACYIEDTLAQNEEKRAVLAAVKLLPADYRETLYLQYFEGFSIAEICKVTKRKKKQVYNLLARAKAALSEILEKGELSL